MLSSFPFHLAFPSVHNITALFQYDFDTESNLVPLPLMIMIYAHTLPILSKPVAVMILFIQHCGWQGGPYFLHHFSYECPPFVWSSIIEFFLPHRCSVLWWCGLLYPSSHLLCFFKWNIMLSQHKTPLHLFNSFIIQKMPNLIHLANSDNGNEYDGAL